MTTVLNTLLLYFYRICFSECGGAFCINRDLVNLSSLAIVYDDCQADGRRFPLDCMSHFT
jgi:hypothetical protein